MNKRTLAFLLALSSISLTAGTTQQKPWQQPTRREKKMSGFIISTLGALTALETLLNRKQRNLIFGKDARGRRVWNRLGDLRTIIALSKLAGGLAAVGAGSWLAHKHWSVKPMSKKEAWSYKTQECALYRFKDTLENTLNRCIEGQRLIAERPDKFANDPKQAQEAAKLNASRAFIEAVLAETNRRLLSLSNLDEAEAFSATEGLEPEAPEETITRVEMAKEAWIQFVACNELKNAEPKPELCLEITDKAYRDGSLPMRCASLLADHEIANFYTTLPHYSDYKEKESTMPALKRSQRRASI